MNKSEFSGILDTMMERRRQRREIEEQQLALRNAFSPKKLTVRDRMLNANAKRTQPKVNFTSNVPSGTEVASVFPYKSSSSSTIYECRLYKDGTTSCNCPGWTRRVGVGGARECKHTRDVDAKKGTLLAALNGTVLTLPPAPAVVKPKGWTPAPAHAAAKPEPFKPIRRFNNLDE